MEELPILMSGPMIPPILEGRKTQTRRLRGLGKINEHPNWYAKAVKLDADGPWSFWYPDRPSLQGFAQKAYPKGGGFKCPYGQPGDRLWVKETFNYLVDGIITYRVGNEIGITYRVGNEIGVGVWKWKSPIFMPRWASRITLEVVSVRCERLQSITEEDAIAEGVGYGFQMNAGWPDYQHVKKNGICELTQDTAQMSFASLWDSLNGKKYPWTMNPWLWRIEFRRIEK